MKNLLYKELKLSASVLSYVFIAGALLIFVPGVLTSSIGFSASLEASASLNAARSAVAAMSQ